MRPRCRAICPRHGGGRLKSLESDGGRTRFTDDSHWRQVKRWPSHLRPLPPLCALVWGGVGRVGGGSCATWPAHSPDPSPRSESAVANFDRFIKRPKPSYTRLGWEGRRFAARRTLPSAYEGRPMSSPARPFLPRTARLRWPPGLPIMLTLYSSAFGETTSPRERGRVSRGAVPSTPIFKTRSCFEVCEKPLPIGSARSSWRRWSGF